MPSGKLWCAQCKKRVIVVKEGTSPVEETSTAALTRLESTLLTKIEEIEGRIREEEDPERLERLGNLMSTLLETLEKVRRTQNSYAPRR
jgi:uncharacterized Zn finger protein (UPF0148 family)